MIPSRDFVSIRGIAVRHITAARDWCCGACGSSLVTRWFDDDPNWRTVCANDPEHDTDEFILKASWEWLEHRRHMNGLEAQEIFDHLPADVQAILKGDENEPD